MSFRTNPDRILDNIDRSRSRDDGGMGSIREATARVLDTEPLPADATQAERVRRIFAAVERAYKETASAVEMRKLAARFQAVGDMSNLRGRGDVIVVVYWLDHDRPDDTAMTPFEIRPEQFAEIREVTRSSQPDANGLRILREVLRDGVVAAAEKLEARVREGTRERADLGHIGARVTLDLRPAG
jgi:hypothetical protein